MKWLCGALVCLASISAFAETYFEVLPLQTQFRFEDSVSQTRAIQRYDGWLNLGFQYKQFRATYTQSLKYDSSGAGTILIETKKTDQIFSGGYRFLQIKSVASSVGVSLELFANAYAGATQSEVVTKLFGTSSKSQSDPEAVFGLGSSAVGRAYLNQVYAVAEVDLKLLYSNNFSPQAVGATGIKLGLGFFF